MSSGLLELVIPSVCPGCDRPRAEGVALLCARCRPDLRPLPMLRGIRTAIAYEGRAIDVIQHFKFEGRRDALAVLLPWLVERCRGLDIDGVVPLPRHPQRVRDQGLDPTHVLARALSRQRGVPVLSRALRRSRPTPPQTDLPASRRRANVAGSFSARPESLRGRRVLLLDDVTTTGSTLREAARTLRLARPRAILPMALAATPALPPGPGPAL